MLDVNDGTHEKNGTVEMCFLRAVKGHRMMIINVMKILKTN